MDLMTLALAKKLVGSGSGVPGKDGASAYEIAVAHGFEGTDEEWLESLKGESVDISELEEAINNKPGEKIPGAEEGSVCGEIFNNYANNTAYGNYSHAEGYKTTASGYYSHTEGRETEAGGESSHAEGNRTEASGMYSHAEGFSTTASGMGSHSEGMNTNALSANASHAEGFNTTSSGDGSHSEGFNTTASGMGSHAEGLLTKASGDGSHAEGGVTEASGAYAYAGGYMTIASGVHSHAEGTGTIAASDAQHVQGQYNIEDADGVYAHIVGWGTSDGDRKNINTIDTNGNGWFAGKVSAGTAQAPAEPTEANDLITKKYFEEHLTRGVAVADASDESDIYMQFNALLASLRAAGVIAIE